MFSGSEDPKTWLFLSLDRESSFSTGKWQNQYQRLEKGNQRKYNDQKKIINQFDCFLEIIHITKSYQIKSYK